MGLYCGDFHMATSVLWSSGNDSGCDIAVTIMSGVDTIICIDYQIYGSTIKELG